MIVVTSAAFWEEEAEEEGGGEGTSHLFSFKSQICARFGVFGARWYCRQRGERSTGAGRRGRRVRSAFKDSERYMEAAAHERLTHTHTQAKTRPRCRSASPPSLLTRNTAQPTSKRAWSRTPIPGLHSHTRGCVHAREYAVCAHAFRLSSLGQGCRSYFEEVELRVLSELLLVHTQPRHATPPTSVSGVVRDPRPGWLRVGLDVLLELREKRTTTAGWRDREREDQRVRG